MAVRHSDLFTRMAASELGCQVVAEYKFHPERKWRFDYALPQHRVALEVEGGVWTGGRHVNPKGFLGDMEKYNTATILGWRILRVTPDQLMSGRTVDMLRATING